MKRVVLVSLVAACMAAANPVFMTYLSEFSTDPAHQWLELHPQPDPWPLYVLDTVVVTTPASVCTLDFSGDTDYYAVVDSQSLAQGILGHGTFRLSPDSGFLRIASPRNWFATESVYYPRLPTGGGSSPTPPPGGSAAFWHLDFGLEQIFNWYIDSTSTPGDSNDGYSQISGTIRVDSGVLFDLSVRASGQFGHCRCDCGYPNYQYAIDGLGAGRYWVEGRGTGGGHEYYGRYPESVDVGFNQNRSGVDIVLRPYAIGETPASSLPAPLLSYRGHKLSLTTFVSQVVQLELYDPVGRCRATLIQGRQTPGRREYDVSRLVGPGSYFARLVAGDCSKASKVIVAR